VAGYLFANATWSQDPSNAFIKAGWFVGVVLMTFATCRALRTWPPAQIRVATNSLLIGLAVGMAFILVELTSSFTMARSSRLLPMSSIAMWR